MKLILLYLCLVGISYAGPLRKPRRAGYGSKSEEMMQFGPYGYINSPQIAGSFYGYHSNYPQMFSQWPILPLQRFFLWPQSESPTHQASRLPQKKPQQIPGTKQPNQRPQLPSQQQPRYQQPQPLPKQPQKTNPSQTYPQVPFQHPKEGKQQQQQPQGFPPYSQPPWHFPQHMPFGQPPVSNEEGTPYFGYGYHGLGNRPPYYSEEMFEQDFEKPKEKEPAKENPASDPTTNSTVSDTNSTIPASHGENATLSGISTTNNEANFPGLSKKIVSGNGIPTPSPTGHMSGQNEAAQNGFDQSNYRPKSTNTNVFHNFFSGNQQPRGRGTYIYKPNPDISNSRHNTLVSRGNPSMQAENPEEPWVYRDNSVHRANLQRINSNHPTAKNRPNSYGEQEKFHYPGNNPSSWRAHPSSDPGPQWNKNPSYGSNKQPSSPSESHSLNKVEENTDRYHPSRKQQSNGQSHDIFLDTRGTPFEKEAHKNDWNEQSFIHPDHQREQFPSLQNQMWNQKDLEIVKETPPGYNSAYSPGSFHQREHATYSDKNSYRQQAPSFYPRFWDDKENFPTIEHLGQRERPSYSPLLPSDQMHRSEYHGSIQQENELYSRQNIQPHEKHLADPDIQYQNPPYNPNGHHINPKYYTEHPANERGNLPYEEINRWIPEHSPVHNSEHYEKVPYHISNTHGHTEKNLPYPGPYPSQQTSNIFQERSPYDERDTWATKMADPSALKETSPYFNTYSSNIRRNPTYTEDTWRAVHISAPISSNNGPGRRNYPNTGIYPREHETITSQPTINYFCCAGESPGGNENILAPLRIAPQFKMVSWEQKSSPTYPEGSHALYARRPAYLAGIQSNHWNNSLKSNQRENPGDFFFGEEVADLQMSPPCSNSPLGQTSDHDTIYETGLFPSKSILCSKNSIRGDGHSVLAHIVEVNQPKRDFERATLTFPQPQSIRNEAVSDIDRKDHRATQGFGWTPCFGSWLEKHTSSTGTPLVNQPSDVFYLENSMHAGKPIMLPEPQPMSSTVPSQDVGEDQLKLTSPEEQMGQPNERTTDCLLLQNE